MLQGTIPRLSLFLRLPRLNGRPAMDNSLMSCVLDDNYLCSSDVLTDEFISPMIPFQIKKPSLQRNQRSIGQERK